MSPRAPGAFIGPPMTKNVKKVNSQYNQSHSTKPLSVKQSNYTKSEVDSQADES